MIETIVKELERQAAAGGRHPFDLYIADISHLKDPSRPERIKVDGWIDLEELAEALALSLGAVSFDEEVVKDISSGKSEEVEGSPAGERPIYEPERSIGDPVPAWISSRDVLTAVEEIVESDASKIWAWDLSIKIRNLVKDALHHG